MSFSQTQLDALKAPLSRSHVKGRNQGGRQVSYIEGWHAIDEANRIFGFDGWTRETFELRCVSEKEREIGTSKAQGWGVTYIARVRIMVGNICREGSGAGHGIDRDLGQAHESALKEAETDAMKRALMTFGNPFGLALYDKEQANVVEEPDSRALYVETCKTAISSAVDAQELRAWWDGQKQVRRDFDLSKEQVSALMDKLTAKLKEIEPKKEAA
jgi:DNA repair and recombination protein RAD52